MTFIRPYWGTYGVGYRVLQPLLELPGILQRHAQDLLNLAGLMDDVRKLVDLPTILKLYMELGLIRL